MVNGSLTFANWVRIILSLAAIPIVVAIVQINVHGYLQQTDAMQLQDNAQATGAHQWLANNQDAVTLGALILVLLAIWFAPLVRLVFPYYVKH